MLNRPNIPRYLFLTLIVGLILFLNLKPAVDPDLGWHLRAGADLLQQKTIPLLDRYSFTMPDWQRESHEWLTNGLMYFIYQHGGYFALSIIFALITVAAFWLISRLTKAKIEYSLLAVLLASLGSLPITGVRVQMLTLLGLAILLFLLFRWRSDQNKKTIYFLPLLFFVWVNLHGGFSIGLLVLGGFIFFEGLKLILPWVKNKFKNNELFKESLTPASWLKLIYLSLFAFAATFINPYGYRVYALVINVLQDSYGRARIGEWQAFSASSPIGWAFLLYLILLGILVIIYWQKIDLTMLGLAIVFTFSALAGWRNLPVLIIITVPLWVYIVAGATDPVLPELLQKKLTIGLFLIAVIIIGYQQITSVWSLSGDINQLAAIGGYPQKAINYIKANPQKFSGNMYNEYNWGGWLIWQLPEHKVFIDGRMPHLQIGDRHIFKDFNDVQELKEPKKILDKYKISCLLIYKDRLLASYLPSAGYAKVYEDDLAAIYLK